MAEHNLEQREIHYAGRVQGVGFRYTVRSVAAQFDVTGFVRNLPDGGFNRSSKAAAGDVDGLLEAVKAGLRFTVRSIAETIRRHRPFVEICTGTEEPQRYVA